MVQRLRSGDAEAGYRFVQDYYPRIFHYLLYLTGQREGAEDLTQETFLQAWRRLKTFDERLALGPWLCQIARREFLQALRRRRSEASLEEVAELPARPASPETDGVELRAILGKLPRQQREILVLHDLEGYTSEEIARIVGLPAGTVRYRLSQARERLRRELGEGDLLYLNDPVAPMRQWRWLPLEAMTRLQARPRMESPRPPAGPPTTKEDEMERREFLRQAAVGAAGLMLTETEKEIVDSRLTQKVTCAFKGTALSDLCEKLKGDSGIPVTAGPSVADEKVTMFCEKLPLREVMRQLSRPFGYTWLRSGTPGEYRYELVQGLRSQLLEEELRNRDRNAALLSLEQEIEKYRPYLDLSPDEVLARAQRAPLAEKKVLESLGGGRSGPGLAWGVTQMYFRLTPAQLAALRAGEELRFSQEPRSGELPLPPDVARGVLQSLRTWRVFKTRDGYGGTEEPDDPRGIPLTAVPEARALVSVKLSQTEPGQFGLDGLVGYYAPGGAYLRSTDGPYAVGVNPKTLQPENAVLNAKLARDTALRAHVSVQPQPSCNLSTGHSARREGGSEGEGEPREPKVITADVLEALHRETGMPIVSDFYTRLYKPSNVSMTNQPLYDALNSLGDTMLLRWNKEERWLQFRSVSYYHDRPKEVPNRLLSRWATVRREQEWLGLEELVEISQLSDAQLGAANMAEGIRECWGLPEWELVRSEFVLANLRFLARLTPAQRQEAQSMGGLLFTKMTLAQQQAFFNRQLDGQPEIHSLEELAGAALRVDYTQPGSFEWQSPDLGSLRWAVRSGPDAKDRWLPVPVICERTQEAALQALYRIDPQLRAVVNAALQALADRGYFASRTAIPPEEARIVPTRLDLRTVYIPGTANNPVTVWAKGHQYGSG